jgi:integrase
MYIKRSIKFLLHKRKSGATKKLGIRMRVTLSGKPPIDFPIGYSIDLENWDVKAERVKIDRKGKNNQITTEINRLIDEYESAINEVFARFELLEKRSPTLEEIKGLFNSMVGRKKASAGKTASEDGIDFFDVFDLFTKNVGKQNQWTQATYGKFVAIRNHLSEFDPYLSFSSLDEEKMQEYVEFLVSKGFRNTTIAKDISFVKWYIKWASNKGYYLGNVHEAFNPKMKGSSGNAKDVIFLNHHEIEALQNYKFGKGQGRLERARDVFLFTCFTGLRYSDVVKLTRHDVKDGFIQIVTQKTVDNLRIELNKHAQALLDKYMNIEFPTDKALPVVSNAHMNEYLKEVCELCGLDELQRVVYFIGGVRHEKVYPKWQLVSTHCGRRTFVVNALQLGIPAEVIMRWTGHSDYKSMKPYVKIVDELKKREMSKFDDMFDNKDEKNS